MKLVLKVTKGENIKLLEYVVYTDMAEEKLMYSLRELIAIMEKMKDDNSR